MNPCRGWIQRVNGYVIIVAVLCSLMKARFPNQGFEQRLGQNPTACAVGTGPATPGYKADITAGCETYFYCHADGAREVFSCPFGMLFDERKSTCEPWSAVTCGGANAGGMLADPLPSSQLVTNQNYAPFIPTASGVVPGTTALGGSSYTPPGNPMDFLAALLFPPVSGQHDINDFVNSAPSGVRQSFMRVAGEGQVPPSQLTVSHGQGYPSYAEPLAGQRPSYQETGLASLEGGKSRESPGSNGMPILRRPSRPSPAMNPMDVQNMQHGSQPQTFDSGPVPPHMLSSQSTYNMFGQLNMLQNQSYATPQPASQFGTYNPQVELLRPIMRSLILNPYQPHLRRMASLLAGGTAMDMGIVSGKMVTDPLGTAADPGVSGAKNSNKPGKALDDGLVDAKK